MFLYKLRPCLRRHPTNYNGCWQKENGSLQLHFLTCLLWSMGEWPAPGWSCNANANPHPGGCWAWDTKHCALPPAFETAHKPCSALREQLKAPGSFKASSIFCLLGNIYSKRLKSRTCMQLGFPPPPPTPTQSTSEAPAQHLQPLCCTAWQAALLAQFCREPCCSNHNLHTILLYCVRGDVNEAQNCRSGVWFQQRYFLQEHLTFEAWFPLCKVGKKPIYIPKDISRH